MPFTAFHLGPGAALKALGGRHFSFMVFGGSQVLIDLEPLIALSAGWERVHGHTHTLVAALAIGTLAGLTGRPISTWVLERMRIPHWPLTWRSAFLSGYIGTFSHVLIDALMHADMQPLWPVTASNPALALIPADAVRYGCVALGFVGTAVLGERWLRYRRRARAARA